MSENFSHNVASASVEPALAAANGQQQIMSNPEKQGFLRRYRLPLTLGVLAICLYIGSIAYILYVRGPVA